MRIPIVQIRRNLLVAYEVTDHYRKTTQQSIKFQTNVSQLVKTEKYIGKLTDGARKRLSKAIQLLQMCAKTQEVYNETTGKYQSHRLSFITLTMPPSELAGDSKYTHKYLLQPMLRVMRRRYGMKMYVWKTELQNNGSIHYHITSDCFIPFARLREEWNKILDNAQMLDYFIEKYQHKNPNSVDVRKVKSEKDLERYLLKYIMKAEDEKPNISSKVWDCSKNLKAGKFFSTPADHTIFAQIQEAEKAGKCQTVTKDFCTLYIFTHSNLHYYFSQSTQRLYYEHINHIRNSSHEKADLTENIQTVSARAHLFSSESHTLEYRTQSQNFGYDTEPDPRRFNSSRAGSVTDPYRHIISGNQEMAQSQIDFPF